jgi:hypothetical protein
MRSAHHWAGVSTVPGPLRPPGFERLGAPAAIEHAQLAERQRGPFVDVVLLLGEQLPGQARELWATATVAILLPRRDRTR